MTCHFKWLFLMKLSFPSSFCARCWLGYRNVFQLLRHSMRCKCYRHSTKIPHHLRYHRCRRAIKRVRERSQVWNSRWGKVLWIFIARLGIHFRKVFFFFFLIFKCKQRTLLWAVCGMREKIGNKLIIMNSCAAACLKTTLEIVKLFLGVGFCFLQWNYFYYKNKQFLTVFYYLKWICFRVGKFLAGNFEFNFG